jgi:hypothetical protein
MRASHLDATLALQPSPRRLGVRALPPSDDQACFSRPGMVLLYSGFASFWSFNFNPGLMHIDSNTRSWSWELKTGENGVASTDTPVQEPRLSNEGSEPLLL